MKFNTPQGDWQILLLLLYSEIAGFVFALVAYGTSSQWATIIYWVATSIFLGWLCFFKWVKFKGKMMPFGFQGNAPAYAYALSLFLVPVMWVVAEGMMFFTSGTFDQGTLIPEFFSHFVTLTSVPIISWLASLGSFGTFLQELALQLGDVAPAEELFKTFTVATACWIVMLAFKKKGVSRWVSLGVMTLFNAIWTWMHGILSYHSINDFLTAFADGQIIITQTWFFYNPVPAVITHAIWNTLGAFQLLTVLNMVIMGIAFGGLTVIAYMRLPHGRQQ